MSIKQNHLTALHVASSKGRAEVVGVLLAAKATVNTQLKVSSALCIRTVQTHDMLDWCCVFHGDSLYRLESLLFGQPVSVVTRKWWNC